MMQYSDVIMGMKNDVIGYMILFGWLDICLVCCNWVLVKIMIGVIIYVKRNMSIVWFLFIVLLFGLLNVYMMF